MTLPAIAITSLRSTIAILLIAAIHGPVAAKAYHYRTPLQTSKELRLSCYTTTTAPFYSFLISIHCCLILFAIRSFIIFTMVYWQMCQARYKPNGRRLKLRQSLNPIRTRYLQLSLLALQVITRPPYGFKPNQRREHTPRKQP